MGTKRSSRLRGFHRLDLEQRRRAVCEWLADASAGFPGPGLSDAAADVMIENAVGVFALPLGIAANFVVNGSELLIPVALEEPSVVAALSNAARMARAGGGFSASVDPPLTTAQVEVLDPGPGAAERLCRAFEELREIADRTQPELCSLGGGLREIEVRAEVGTRRRLVVHLHVDCRDAMGANMVNTMAEAVSARVAELAGGRAGLRILTNLAERRLARASCAVPVTALGREGRAGAEVARGIVAACDFADADPNRAATHNKGIFNAVDGVLLATGNDWRAIEAGGHAFAARSGRYLPLSRWRVDGDSLRGQIELPLPVGIVGGACSAHPTARRCIALLGAKSAGELACVIAAAGLAANLAALAALASEGIQAGHMRLHRRRLE
jgi:hydroxymethylglutaryl-CoA reductase